MVLLLQTGLPLSSSKFGTRSKQSTTRSRSWKGHRERGGAGKGQSWKNGKKNRTKPHEKARRTAGLRSYRLRSTRSAGGDALGVTRQHPIEKALVVFKRGQPHHAPLAGEAARGVRRGDRDLKFQQNTFGQ